MAESKKETIVPDSDKNVSDSNMTPQYWQHLSNGNLPNFESPAQLDNWFDAQLMQMYSEVVSEPLPKEFLDLLEKLREKSKSDR